MGENGLPIPPPGAPPMQTVSTALTTNINLTKLRDTIKASYVARWGNNEGPKKFASRSWTIADLASAYKGFRFDSDPLTRQAFAPALIEMQTALTTIRANAVAQKNTNLTATIDRGLNTRPAIDLNEEYSHEVFFALIGDDGSLHGQLTLYYQRVMPNRQEAANKMTTEKWSFKRLCAIYSDLSLDDRSTSARALLPLLRGAFNRLLNLQGGTKQEFFNQFGQASQGIEAGLTTWYRGNRITNIEGKLNEAWPADRIIRIFGDLTIYLRDRSATDRTPNIAADAHAALTAFFNLRLTEISNNPNVTPVTTNEPQTTETFFAQFSQIQNLQSSISNIYTSIYRSPDKINDLWTVERLTNLYSDYMRDANDHTFTQPEKDQLKAALPLMRQALFALLVKAQPAAGQPAPTTPNPAIAQISPLLKVGEFDAATFQAVVTNTIVALATEHKKEGGNPPFDAAKIKADPRYKALQALMGTSSFMNSEFAKDGNPVREQIRGWNSSTPEGRTSLAILRSLTSNESEQPSIIAPTDIPSLGIYTDQASTDAAAINAASGIITPVETPAAPTAPVTGVEVPAGTLIRTDVSGTTYARFGNTFYKVADNKWGEAYAPQAPKAGTKFNSNTNPVTYRGVVNGGECWTARGDDGKDYVVSYDLWTNMRFELKQSPPIIGDGGVPVDASITETPVITVINQ